MIVPVDAAPPLGEALNQREEHAVAVLIVRRRFAASVRRRPEAKIELDRVGHTHVLVFFLREAVVREHSIAVVAQARRRFGIVALIRFRKALHAAASPVLIVAYMISRSAESASSWCFLGNMSEHVPDLVVPAALLRGAGDKGARRSPQPMRAVGNEQRGAFMLRWTKSMNSSDQLSSLSLSASSSANKCLCPVIGADDDQKDAPLVVGAGSQMDAVGQT